MNLVYSFKSSEHTKGRELLESGHRFLEKKKLESSKEEREKQRNQESENDLSRKSQVEAELEPDLPRIWEKKQSEKPINQESEKQRSLESEVELTRKSQVDVEEKKKTLTNRFSSCSKKIESKIKKNLKPRLAIDSSKKPDPERQSSKIVDKDISNKSRDRETLLLFRLISSLYLVKKFISRLHAQANLRRTKFLREKHYNLINDLAVNTPTSKEEKDAGYGLNRALRKLKGGLNHLKKIAPCRCFKLGKYLKTFDPTKTFHTIWDILMILFIMVYFIIIPINLGFDINLWGIWAKSSPLPTSIFRTLSIYFFFVDIAVNFNTAIYRRGKLETSRKVIAKNYIGKQFFRDLLSSGFLLVEYYNLDYGLRWFGVLFVTRIFTISEIVSRLEQLLLYDNRLRNKILLINLIIRVIVLSHIFACSWHYLAIIQNSQDTWLHLANIQNEDWLTKYIYSFYYVAVTMNTVGFGDIHPNNKLEVVYTIFFVYVACGVFAYNLNSVGLIVQDINRQDNMFKRNLILINGYMRKKHITNDLRVKIRKYLEYIWLEENTQTNEDESKIISKLSETLKEELLLEANGKILKDIPYFSNNFSEELLRKTVNIIEEVRFTPEDIIFMKDDIDDNSLYVVRKGEVEVFVITPRKNQPMTSLKKLKNGEAFGEFSFFTGFGRKTCARSTEFTTLYKIRQKDFLNLMVDHPDDFEKFCMIRDKILLYKSMDELEIKCYSCNLNGHFAIDCPLLHCTPSREVIIHRHIFSKPSERRTVTRKSDSFKFSALLNKLVVKDELVRFRSDNNLDINNSDDDELTYSEKEFAEVEETLEFENSPKERKVKLTMIPQIIEKEEFSTDELSLQTKGKTQEEEANEIEFPKQNKHVLSIPGQDWKLRKRRKSKTDIQIFSDENEEEGKKNVEENKRTVRSESRKISGISWKPKLTEMANPPKLILQRHPESLSFQFGSGSPNQFDSERNKEMKEDIQISNLPKNFDRSSSKTSSEGIASLGKKIPSKICNHCGNHVQASYLKNPKAEYYHQNQKQDKVDDMEKVRLLKHLDSMKRFNFYFCHNNIENVIKIYEKPSLTFKSMKTYMKKTKNKREENISNPLKKKRFFKLETGSEKNLYSPLKRNTPDKSKIIIKFNKISAYFFGKAIK